jgi:hypothetical protein
VNFFLDCEFTNFFGKLISMGIVADDGARFYEELEVENWKQVDPWVWANVVPHLTGPSVIVTRPMFTDRLKHFFAPYDEIDIIVDWPDDIRYFCEMLITGPGRMIHGRQNMRFHLRRDLSTDKSLLPHHALHDALALREAFYEGATA